MNEEKRGNPHVYLYLYGENKDAVRHGNYKYLNYKGEVELYNIEVDILESIDLSEIKPEIKNRLEEILSFY